MINFLKKYDYAIAGILISGICWYLGSGLKGNFWYLMWIAPLAILHLSLKSTWRIAFIASFLAYLIGRLSWLHYLLSVLPLVPALIAIVIVPLIFALLVCWNRYLVLRFSAGWTVFILPVLWTSFEFLMIISSRDGSAGSIAYTQMKFIPIIQIASITGITGISFLLMLVPSALAIAIFFSSNKALKPKILIIPAILLVFSLAFGVYRMNSLPQKVRSYPIGLACLDESMHEETQNPDPEKEIRVAEGYSAEIDSLAASGVKLILLPEKILTLTPSTDSLIIGILQRSAFKNKTAIITGYTRIKDNQRLNAEMVIDSQGQVIADYTKVNLFEGEERNGFIAGAGIGLFSLENNNYGLAICKDLDFPVFIRSYGMAGISANFVPAWDFVEDGWLHSRMAVMRSIENGFSLVRCAREGRLSISDPCGRVLFEASSENRKKVTLSGLLTLQPSKTIYSQTGESFGLINAILALAFLGLLFIRKSPSRKT